MAITAQEDIVAATKVPCEDSADTGMGGFGSKIAGNQAMEIELEKQDEVLSASVVNAQETIEGSGLTIGEKDPVVIEKVQRIEGLNELKYDNGVTFVTGEKPHFEELFQNTCEKAITSCVEQKVDAFVGLIGNKVNNGMTFVVGENPTFEELVQNTCEEVVTSGVGEKVEAFVELIGNKVDNGVTFVGDIPVFEELVQNICEKTVISGVGENMEASVELFGNKIENCVREKAENVEESPEDKHEGEDGGTSLVGQEVEILENKCNISNGGMPVLVNSSDDKIQNGKENEFRVGDFVWGKIRNHPWWPGQIYDPRDASDTSMKHTFNENNRLLVAFIGDGSCAWCLPTQVVPFVENFAEMSTGCKTWIFQASVQMALDEIGRNLELEMVCNCVPEEHSAGLAQPVLDNVGVKESVLRPNIKFPQISVAEYESSDVLKKLRCYAESTSFSNGLELTVLRSWISGFYRSKGGHALPLYREPVIIEGLEDKSIVVAKDVSVQSKLPFAGPLDDDEFPFKLLGFSDGKSHIRKRMSVAKLLESSTKEGSDLAMPLSSLKRKKTEKQSSQSGSVGKSKKRKVEDLKSSEHTNGSVLEGAMEELASSKKQKTFVLSDAETNTSNAKDDSEIVTSPRERKPSKYLSFPFTGLTGRASTLHSKSDKIAKKPREKKPSKENLPGFELEENIDDSPLNAITNETVFPLYDVSMPADEFLSYVTIAAVDPKSLKNEDSVDLIKDFASARRSSTYLEGGHYGTFKRCKKVDEMPSDDDELVTDAKSVTNKIEVMTEILGSYGSDFSSEEKLKIKDAMKNLMQTVDSVSEMVEASRDKVRNSIENGFSS